VHPLLHYTVPCDIVTRVIPGVAKIYVLHDEQQPDQLGIAYQPITLYMLPLLNQLISSQF